MKRLHANSQYKFVVLTLFLFSSLCYSQEKSKYEDDENYWISTNLGLTFGSPYSGELYDLNLEYSSQKSVYSVNVFSFRHSGGFFIEQKPFQKVMSGVNIQYGRIMRDLNFKFIYSAGMSLMHSVERRLINNKKTTKKNIFGIPLSAQIIVTPFQFTALGLKGYMNLNSENLIAGASLGIYFGKVK